MKSTTKWIIPPRVVSIGGVDIKRLLPFREKRMVGPFIYFDHFPPTDFAPGQAIDVHPHPHIGLSTLSYLLEGQVLHHDSLDNVQVLLPGDVNWMTAGRGIAHSERAPREIRDVPHRLHLLQFWVALPKEHEDRAPSFAHHAKENIPQIEKNGAQIRIVAGKAFDQVSPVDVYSDLFFMDVTLPRGKSFTFDPQEQELAFYVLKGKVRHDADLLEAFSFVVLSRDQILDLKAEEDSQFVVLGGKAFPEERFIFWNFVSSSQEKINQAKTAWREGSFPHVPRESDNVPIPEEKK
jgi:redox-sensitive bicupin YhaK (pirin superfamily)